ncbi:MAG TPA: DUF4440 domain-containing protein [Blastocatellia bacterium]|nr:DUF4440 domain-containing protein [Blastocatellia bacterium]
MKKTKLLIASVFMVSVIVSLAGQAMGYPPFVLKARKFGAKDCTFCHVDPEGGPPWNERGQWLMSEKARRKADAVDPEWLADYKPGASAGKKEPQPDSKPAEVKPAEKAPASPVEQELMKLERDWMESVKKRDGAALGNLLADDFFATDEQGRVTGKSEYVSEMKGMSVDSYNVGEFSFRINGETAVVSERWEIKASFQGQDISGAYRETNVWMKRDGRWRVVSTHISRIPQKY